MVRIHCRDFLQNKVWDRTIPAVARLTGNGVLPLGDPMVNESHGWRGRNNILMQRFANLCNMTGKTGDWVSRLEA